MSFKDTQSYKELQADWRWIHEMDPEAAAAADQWVKEHPEEWKELEHIVPDSHVTVIRAAHSIQSIYVYAFMKANQSELEKEGEGSTNQKELKPLTLKEMLIPIPPYSEQERIVATITAAFSTISAIENSLN